MFANFQNMVKEAESSVGVTVFFNDDVTEEQILEINNQVELREEVATSSIYPKKKPGKSSSRGILPEVIRVF